MRACCSGNGRFPFLNKWTELSYLVSWTGSCQVEIEIEVIIINMEANAKYILTRWMSVCLVFKMSWILCIAKRVIVFPGTFSRVFFFFSHCIKLCPQNFTEIIQHSQKTLSCPFFHTSANAYCVVILIDVTGMYEGCGWSHSLCEYFLKQQAPNKDSDKFQLFFFTAFKLYCLLR